ncbi:MULTISPECIES: cysteine dioxygenase family protein [Cupriavidus]|uniref:cysteine dioxygenase family protein n=1 Tax=Cupriavidus sp. DF5525 TaxID=3160989 RepID=UPI0032DF7732
MSQSTPQERQSARRQAIAEALTEIRRLAGAQPDRETLASISTRLQALASQRTLFTHEDFPPPSAAEGSGASTRYRLNPADGDDGIALYLNAINPGKTTIPHNHDTWAVIVAVEGREHNRVYRRTDNGQEPGVARLELVQELTVEPGTSIAFLPDDIHSIHVLGDTPTLHFHLYGRPLETLTGRYGVRLETGEIVNYNATQMQPSKVAA